MNAEEPMLDTSGMLTLDKAIASLHIASGTKARFGASTFCRCYDPLKMLGAATFV